MNKNPDDDNNIDRELRRNVQELEALIQIYRRRGHSTQAVELATHLEEMQREGSGQGRSHS